MNYYAIGAFITFFTTIFLAVFLLLVDWQKRLHQTYALANLSVAFWSLFYIFWQTSNTYDSAFVFLKFLMYGATFMPVFLLHFICSYLEIEQKKRSILFVVYVIGIAFLFGINANLLFNTLRSKAGFPFWPDAGIIMPAYLFFFFGVIIYAMTMLYRNYRSSVGIRRTRTGYLFLALLIAILAGSPNYALWYDIPIKPILNPLFAVYVALIAYAITKHRLMDISIVISRAVAWVLTVVFLGAVYGGLVLLYRTYITPQIDLIFFAWTILYGILVGETFQRIRLFIQTTSDKVFLRGKYDYYKELSDITTQITKTLSMENILNTLHRAFYEVLEVSNPRIYLPEDFDKPEIRELLTIKELTFRGEDLIIPCLLEDRLIALIILGKKLSEDPYTEEDLRLLRALASQTAVALDHTHTYEEIKKELQASQQKLIETTPAAREIFLNIIG